jgi:hypothetical protein
MLQLCCCFLVSFPNGCDTRATTVQMFHYCNNNSFFIPLDQFILYLSLFVDEKRLKGSVQLKKRRDKIMQPSLTRENNAVIIMRVIHSLSHHHQDDHQEKHVHNSVYESGRSSHGMRFSFIFHHLSLRNTSLEKWRRHWRWYTMYMTTTQSCIDSQAVTHNERDNENDSFLHRSFIRVDPLIILSSLLMSIECWWYGDDDVSVVSIKGKRLDSTLFLCMTRQVSHKQ